VTTTFEYNGDGDRYAQTVNGVTTDYVLDPVGLAQVLMETTSGQSKHYLPGLAQYDATNGWQYVTSDRVGSVRLLVKPNGEVALSQSFDPFGNVLERTGAGQNVFGYTGEQSDPTGLVYLRARYYNPADGRFIAADSLVPDPLLSQGWNGYTYGYNNPLRFIDPSGHCGETYTGNIDLNASINQRCYNLAERFTNELVADGIIPQQEDGSLANLSDYNIYVLEALYSRSTMHLHEAQLILPDAKTLPLGQPFQVTDPFIEYTDLFWLDVASGGFNICGIGGGIVLSVAGQPQFGAIALGAGEGLSLLTDIFSIGYIWQTRGTKEGTEELWEQLKDQGLEKILERNLIRKQERLILKELAATSPSIFGLPFDIIGIVEQYHAGFQIRVTPNP
jgi:RHS repeat-associated protein